MQNEKEFTNWVDTYSDMLFGYLLKHGVDREIARDILQETFLAAWRNMENFRAEASVKNWLFVILKSKVTDYYRKASNKVEMETIKNDYNNSAFFDGEEHWSKGMFPGKFNGSFDNPAETKEYYKMLHTCSNKLKQIQNAVFAM